MIAPFRKWLKAVLYQKEIKQPYSVLMVGLDAAGKTTILYNLTHHVDGKVEDVMLNRHSSFRYYNNNRVMVTIPAIGFVVEMMEANEQSRLAVNCWDVGGSHKIRALWRYYLKNSDAVVFVVDSNDTYRMDNARDELRWFAEENGLKDCPFLILANKQDLPNAAPVEEIRRILRLDEIFINGKRPWRIHGVVAAQDTGIHEAFERLLSGSCYNSSVKKEIVRNRLLFDQGRARFATRKSENESDRNLAAIIHFLTNQPHELTREVVSFLSAYEGIISGVQQQDFKKGGWHFFT